MPLDFSLIEQIEAVIVTPLLWLFGAIGLLVFIFGVAEVVSAGDNAEKRTLGFRHMIWGIIGLFIMVAVVGIIQIIRNTVNLFR
jgi:uncharacterized membrane protein